MNNPEHTPANQRDLIPGNYTDVCISEPTKWQKLLEQESGQEFIDLSSDSLPLPINRANFHYEKDAGDLLPRITAELSMNPGDIPEDEQMKWQSTVINTLKERVGCSGAEIIVLSHDCYSFYIPVPPQSVIRVTTIADPSRCYISVTLDDDSDFRSQIDDSYTNEATEPITSYAALRSCLEVLTGAFDVCVEAYGDRTQPTSRTEVVLSLDEPTNTVPEQRETPPWTVTEGPRFSDIYGYEAIKERLLDFALVHQNPEVAAAIGLESTEGILLYGEPGTGKTKLITAFANEIEAELVAVNSTDVIGKYVGDSAKNIDAIFEKIVRMPGLVVVFMDEFESLGSDNPTGTSERVDTVNRLKQWVVDINQKYHNIILTGATNKLNQVDKALVRPGRFTPIELAQPNEQFRRGIWQTLLGKAAVKAMEVRFEDPEAVTLDIAYDIDYEKLAAASHGMVGAHINEILNILRKQRLRQYARSGEMSPVTEADLLREINAYNRDI